MSHQVQKLAASASRQINAVVVSSGLMNKTVKVRIGVQKWNKHIQKDFNHTSHLLVHDPASSLRTGDIISISPGWRTSKNVHHVVREIIAPFGEPIEGRPPVPSEEERMAVREAKKAAKQERRRVRIESVGVEVETPADETQEKTRATKRQSPRRLERSRVYWEKKVAEKESAEK
ncbi:hypothetical protein BGZ60DRAFT_455675 [Tricladium varicosporioides]|nr:hypothetical protein BGZ60DRAFT_455675 [Hymenoscyphus varicosporioides]